MADLKQLKAAVEILESAGDIEAIKRALALIGESPITNVGGMPDFETGKNYFIRTVTFYQVGTVVSVSDKFVKLKNSSWIADTGRFADAMKTGNFNEVEPTDGIVGIGLGAIVDFFEFTQPLPTKQK